MIKLNEIKEIVFTQDDMDKLTRLENRPITFDDDCPELSPALEKAFKTAVAQRNTRKNA